VEKRLLLGIAKYDLGIGMKTTALAANYRRREWSISPSSLGMFHSLTARPNCFTAENALFITVTPKAVSVDFLNNGYELTQ
jgi:hypothetical protein